MSEPAFPLVDIGFSRRLERTEGHANARFVESRARHAPEIGACWLDAGGASAMFDGVGSPLTQTFGLGMSGPVTTDVLDRLEAFFTSRGSDVVHEVSPLADPSALTLLNERRYRPCELTSVLFQPLPAASAADSVSTEVTVRRVDAGEHHVWAQTAIRGWCEFPEVLEFMSSFGPVVAGAEDTHPFLALMDGVPVATGSLSIHDGVALLAGASTIPEARGRGAQRALLAARLLFAASIGCTTAMMCAAPGGRSQRNAERSGFRIAYTRIKWVKGQ